MKQKKIGTTLYVFSEDPYVITEDTDANIIYIQEEVINRFARINLSLISKMKPINYHVTCVKHPEWADYYNDFTVYVEQTTGGTVTAYPTSGDEGEEISISHLASEGYDFDSWNVVDEDGNEIEITNNNFLMPASDVTVSAVFIKTYYNQYLTIESQADNNTISWKSSNESYTQDIQYSIDKINWTTVTSTTSGATLATLNTGEKLYLKGSLIGHNSYSYYESINSSGNFIVYGNIMSLTNGDNFASAKSLTHNYQLTNLFNGSKVTDISNLILPATTLTLYCYDSMFRGCTSLTTTPVLPATTLARECYRYMFSGCTSLTTAPELPATTLAYGCYSSMFGGCTSLTTAPDLPAITLKSECYNGMFSGCTLLTTTPELPANKLIFWCYKYMFDGCISLNNITMLATDISGDGLSNWVRNVSATGTFTKAASMSTLPTGASGIPSGWTVVDA